MTRKLHLLLLAPLLAGALAGCGSSGASSTAASRTSAAVTPRTTTVASATAATTTTREASATTHARTTTARRSSSTRSSATRTSTQAARTRAPRPAGPLDLAAAIAVCRREVASAPLTGAESTQLSRLCLTAATLGRRQLGAAERRICLTVIEDSAPGLSGPAIAAARQSCARY
jgi:hypothetical protein